MAVESAFTAFQLARQARQRILHKPHIAAPLDRASRLPRRFEAAARPRPPQSRIGGAVKRNGRRTGRCGKVSNRGVRPDINTRSRDQRR